MHDKFAVVVGKNEIDAGPLELRVEQQLRVGNDNGVVGRVGAVNRLDMRKAPEIRAKAAGVLVGVDFTRVIQGTARYLTNL